ncbi:hypothetical protein L202_08134 [Cryptococcus amylolentus CBS 6039]|uniref:Uncharacterized protein n=1 Tax=Cryptococcus amylolentus CBS 6039 TaxID=1295533 RepID=A0A1E3H985_9TREE|nr:hypothetical protein L202_08134 [Cryptococcus amylolentus CBS 6039]ODN72695.1 hypothetical protein L202_08134 [Cryptococcus amylolentus CBS 6039]
MSSASEVAHTTDILHIIFSHLSADNDLTSLLRTSPLFFSLIAQNSIDRYQYRTSTKLLELVQTVVVERAPLPVDHPVWANWYKLPPLPAVETVIIYPAERNTRQKSGKNTTLPDEALIERLCPTATRLNLSTPCFTAGAKGVQSLPSLPCVETLVLKVNAEEIMELKYFVRKLNYGLWKHGQKERPLCLNIKAVHLLLWGELVYPEAKFLISDWDKDCVDELAIVELTFSTNVKLRDKIFHNLCEIAERLGTRFSIDELWLYNADTLLERLSRWTKFRKVDNMKAKVEREFVEEMKLSAKYLGMPEEAAEAQVFWRTGQEFYEAFGDVSARDETEEWYHTAVLTPSPNLVSLRDRLAAKTKFPADTFVGLTEREAEWTLATFQCK